MAEPDALYRHLVDRGFRLVGVYRWGHFNGLADSADALFVRGLQMNSTVRSRAS